MAIAVLRFLHLHRMESRPDEEKVRDVVTEFLEACADGDFETVWELQSESVHQTVAAQRAGVRADLSDEEFFVENADSMRQTIGETLPENPQDWFPWSLPPTVLADLRIVGTEFENEKDVAVEIRPEGDSRIGRRRCRLELCLKKEGRAWRIYFIELDLAEDLPAVPPPPTVEWDTMPDGRTTLALGLGGGGDQPRLAAHLGSTAVTPADLVLILRVDEAARFATLTPLITEAARAGIGEIRILGRRRAPGTLGTTVFFLGLSFTVMSFGQNDAPDIVYRIRRNPGVPDLILKVGADPSPPLNPEGREGSFFRSALPQDECRALRIATRITGKAPGELRVLLAPDAAATVHRVGNAWYALEMDGFKAPLLAVAGPDRKASMLLNGLTPETLTKEPPPRLPRIDETDPVLERRIDGRR